MISQVAPTALNVMGRHGINGYGLLDQSIEQLAARRRCPPIESERKLIEVVIQMRRTYGTLMCAIKPTLQQGRYSMYQWQHVVANFGLFADDPMLVSLGSQCRVAAPSADVGDWRSCRRYSCHHSGSELSGGLEATFWEYNAVRGESFFMGGA